MAKCSLQRPRRRLRKVSRFGDGFPKSMVFGDPPSIQGLAHVTGSEPKVISHARARPRLWSKLLRGAGPERSVAPPLTPPAHATSTRRPGAEKRMSTIWDIRFAKNEWPTIEAIRFWMRAPAGGAVRGRSGKGKFGSEMRNSLQKRLLWRDRGLIIPYLAAMSHGGCSEPELARAT